MKVREWPAVRVRIHPAVLNKLKANAACEHRSLNAEFAKILEQHFANNPSRKEAPGQAVGSTPDASSYTQINSADADSLGGSHA